MKPQEEIVYREIGKRIRDARKKKRITQSDLRKEVDIARATIANIELGRQSVSVYHLVLIAIALDCNISDIVGDDLPKKIKTMRQKISSF